MDPQIIEVDGNTFYKEFQKNYSKIQNNYRLKLRTKEYYNKCKKLFMLDDYTAGVAVSFDDRVVSLFNIGVHKNVASLLLSKAIEAGATKLECRNVSQLKLLYSRNGFIPVYRTNALKHEFEDEYEEVGSNELLLWIYNEDFRNVMKYSKKHIKVRFEDTIFIQFNNVAELKRDRLVNDLSDIYSKNYINKLINFSLIV